MNCRYSKPFRLTLQPSRNSPGASLGRGAGDYDVCMNYLCSHRKLKPDYLEVYCTAKTREKLNN